MKRFIILLIFISGLISCLSDDSLQEITVENRYSISIPSFLKKAHDLNDDASLQYQHIFREFYVIVIDEPKSELKKALDDNNLTEFYSNDIEGYFDLLFNDFEQGVSAFRKSNLIDTLINNMPAKLLTVLGTVEDIDIFYYLAYIEGEKRYYQIMAWTLASREHQYKEKMRKIIYSLKEL